MSGVGIGGGSNGIVVLEKVWQHCRPSRWQCTDQNAFL